MSCREQGRPGLGEGQPSLEVPRARLENFPLYDQNLGVAHLTGGERSFEQSQALLLRAQHVSVEQAESLAGELVVREGGSNFGLNFERDPVGLCLEA